MNHIHRLGALRARVAGLATALLLSALTLTGCSEQPPPPPLSGGCGIAVDGGGHHVPGLDFNVDALVQQTIVPFLERTNCRNVVFAPIDSTSRASSCTQPPLDLSPATNGNVDPMKLQAALRQKAVTSAQSVLSCIDQEPQPQGSDVLGGIKRLVGLRPAGGGPYALLVISTFINTTAGIDLRHDDLTTPPARDAEVYKVTHQSLMPDLHGVGVYTAGFGINFSRYSALYEGFNLFWQQVLQTDAGCTELHINELAAGATSATPLRT